MPSNPYRAETQLVLNGNPQLLTLNLGAIAALENELEEDSLSGLLKRFSDKKFRADDLAKVLNAGLYGAGSDIDIQFATIEGGALAAAKAAMELLVHGLGLPE